MKTNPAALVAQILLSLALLAPGSGWATPESLNKAPPPIHDFMLGGDFSPIYQGPYAFILMQNAFSGSRCSGVLVGAREVLTAAHCIVSPSDEPQFSPPDYTVVVGNENFDVTQADFNPSYDPDAAVDESSSRYDMGVLTLDRNVTSTSPVPVLRGAPTKRGDTKTLFGFGTNENSTNSQNTLQDLLNQGKFGNLIISSVSGGVLYSSHTNSPVVSCAGDSGGAVVRRASTAHRAVVGVVSAGTTRNASNGVCTTTGPDDVSLFVDLQSATSKQFLAQFPRVQYLTPGFVTFKTKVDRVISSLRKVQDSRSLTTIRTQSTAAAKTLAALRSSAGSTRLPGLLSGISKVRSASASKRLASAQRAVKQSLKTLRALSALGID